MLRVSGILLYIPLFIFNICFSLTNLYGNLPRDVSVLRYNLVEGLPDIYIDQISEKIGRTWMKGYVWDKDLIHKFYSL